MKSCRWDTRSGLVLVSLASPCWWEVEGAWPTRRPATRQKLRDAKALVVVAFVAVVGRVAVAAAAEERGADNSAAAADIVVVADAVVGGAEGAEVGVVEEYCA